MIQQTKIITVFFLVICAVNCILGEEMAFFVSPQGNDANSGTKDQPFKTLEAARDAVRKAEHAEEIVVWLRAGVYERDKTFQLTGDDSGNPGKPVIYRAWPGEEVRIVGGKRITNWKPVTDEAILKRLVPEARSNVLQADLKALGLTNYGQVKRGGIELFYNDQPMTLARWPNEGFVKITGLVEPDTVNVRGTKGSKAGKFMYEGDRPKRWTEENDPWVHGYWFWDWSDERHRVESIDTEKRIIRVAPPYHGYGYRVGQWFYGMNILAELDAPGEWYLDRKTGTLYFWPPTSIESGQAVVSMLDTLVNLSGVSNVAIEAVILEACRGTAIITSNCTKTKIAGCVLRNIGGSAVQASGGNNCSVVACDIYGTGSGGISLQGGERSSLAPAGHVAENNHIHHYGRWSRMYTPAVSLAGVGNRAAHNLIHDAPHMAIGFSGNEHLIEFNEIHDVCLESNDAGAMYAGRDWTMRGTVIRYNYLRDITGFRDKGCVGVYLDDMFCGTKIYGNVFYRVTRAAFIGGGRDCIVENNIFVDCKPALHIDARAMGWASDHVETTMTDRLKAMPYTSELWRERYPELVGILQDEPAAPKGNLVARNISYKGQWDGVYKQARPYVTFEDNFVDKDPHFRGTPPETFELREDSPAYKIGFKPIPFEKIGLQNDAYRTVSSPSGVGKRWPSEKHSYEDSVTGLEVTMLTTSKAKDNKIYQTHPNWTADGQYIVFMSDRSGTNQYYAVSEKTGTIVQLTDEAGPGYACLSRTENRMYYISDRQIWNLDIDAILNGDKQGHIRQKVANLPENVQLSGSITLDSDEKTIYLGARYSADSWGLLALDIQTGRYSKIIDSDFRVGHCQAHPTKSGLLMYCWETGGDSPQRMWIVNADGKGNGPFYKETYDEWVTHEVWWGADKALFTIWPKNEEMLKKPHGIGYVTLEDRSLHILDQKKYWHVGASPDGKWAVGDTFAGELFLVGIDSGQAQLLTQGHRPEGATVHPHPSFSPDGPKVLFCSEKNGNWDLCLVRLKR
ncbi:MAG: right-handed parallel beta-helix repeat-containing protein [Sedimentisphaerales bacterium]|nr:right-handed parallel beta-helix repeat-containing protein [Sedimentisphaerales bacterium]